MLANEVNSIIEKFSQAKLDAMYSGDPTEKQTIKSSDGTLSAVLSANNNGVHAVFFNKANAIISIFYSAGSENTYSFLPRSSEDARVIKMISEKLSLPFNGKQ